MSEFFAIVALVSNLIPFPKKLFSLIPPPKLPPDVPIPAPKEISPVGCSSTVISIIFKLGVDPSEILGSILAKRLRDFILFIDLLNKISL